MSKTQQVDPLFWIKYKQLSWKDFKINNSDFIAFLQVQDVMWIKIVSHQCEGIILYNESFVMEDPEKPLMDPRYGQVLLIDPALAARMKREFIKEEREFRKQLQITLSLRQYAENKEIALSRIFSDHLGPSVLGIVADQLSKKQWFEAWHLLDEHYCRDSLKKKQKVTHLLNNMAYSKHHSMADFISVMCMLFKVHAKLSNGVELGEDYRLLCLVDSIRRGDGGYFNFELSVVGLGGINFEDAESMLVTKADKFLSIAPQVSNKKPNDNSGNGDKSKKQQFEAHQATKGNGKHKKGGTDGSKKNRSGSCHKCGAEGHWSCDPECPQFVPKKSGNSSSGNNKSTTDKQAHNTTSEKCSADNAKTSQEGEKLLVELRQQYKDLEKKYNQVKEANMAHSYYQRAISLSDGDDSDAEHEAYMVTSEWRKLSKDSSIRDQKVVSTPSPIVASASVSNLNLTSSNFGVRSPLPTTAVAPRNTPVIRTLSGGSHQLPTSALTPKVRGTYVVTDPSLDAEITAALAAASARNSSSASTSSGSSINLFPTASQFRPATTAGATRARSIGRRSPRVEELHSSDESDVDTTELERVVNDEVADEDLDLNISARMLADIGRRSTQRAPRRVTAIRRRVTVQPGQMMNSLQTRRSSYTVTRPVRTTAASSNSSQSVAHMMSSSESLSNDSQVTSQVFDTACTDTMVSSSVGLTEFKSVPPDMQGSVYMGGNKKFALPIVGTGSDGILKDILVVDGLKRDLISGPALMKSGLIQMYLDGRTLVFDPKDQMKLVLSGTLGADNLFHRDKTPHGPSFPALVDKLLPLCKPSSSVKELEVPKPTISGRSLTDRQFIYGKAVNRPLASRELVKNQWVILHNRTMHAGRHKLLNMVANQTAIGTCITHAELKKSSMGTCSECYLGKFNKFPAPASFSEPPSANMQIISTDIVGPFRTQSVHANKYFQLHEDRKSQYLFVEFMRKKSEANKELMLLQSRVASPLGLTIRTMQSDSDQIYKDQHFVSWSKLNGIELRYTAPYRHEGSIESRIKSVLEMVRTVIADGNIPEKFWEPLVEHAVYVLNRLPTARHPQSCPYTELYDKVPDISMLVPLGYPSVCKVYDEEPSKRTKLEPKGIKCTVVGYCEATSAYKVVTKSGKLLLRKDVVVDENWCVTRDHKHVTDKKILAIESDVKDEVGAVGDDILVRPSSVSEPVMVRPEPDPPPTLRRSSRVVKAPERLIFQAEKVNSELPYSPKTLNEALSSEHALKWLGAVIKELSEMVSRGVIQDVEPGEKTEKAFGSKVVYRVTKNVDPSLDEVLKFKARIVAQGYSSIFGVHYNETYSPTVLFKSFLIALSIAKRNNWPMRNIDIGNAYLEAQLKRDLYMYLPLDLTGGRKIKVRLARNLYGLKDAGLMWYMFIDKILRDAGYQRSVYDPCVYKKGNNIIVLFVDDMTLTGSSAAELDRVIKIIAARVKKITDMGKLSKFIGIEVFEDPESNHLLLSQLDTTNQYLELHLKNGKAFKHTPIAPSHLLDKLIKDEDESEFRPIWEMVGQIRYLADHTRHDLLYVASKLGSKAASAPATYQQAAEDVMKYLNCTKDLKLRLGGRDPDIKLFGYADASYVAGGDSRSQLGYCFFLNRDSGAVCAKSIKDKTVSQSSTEAEIKALVEAIKECIWLRGLLAELGYPQSEPTVIYQDNTSSIRLSCKVGSESRTRHVVNKLNFIRQEIEQGTVVIQYMHTDQMVADILTGPRERGCFEYLRKILMEGHWRGKGRDNT